MEVLVKKDAATVVPVQVDHLDDETKSGVLGTLVSLHGGENVLVDGQAQVSTPTEEQEAPTKKKGKKNGNGQ